MYSGNSDHYQRNLVVDTTLMLIRYSLLMELTGIQIGLQYSVMSTKKCRTTGGQDGWVPPSKYDFLFPSLLLLLPIIYCTVEEQKPLTDP